MKTSLIKYVLGSLAVLAFLSLPTPSRADVIYSFQDNSTFDYTYGTWNGGNVLPGPTFLSIGNGTARDNGGGGVTLALDPSPFAASGQLQIEAKLLAGNAADEFNVNLFSAIDGNYNVYRFSTAGLNDATFTQLSLSLASPFETHGTIDWTNITKFELQGTYGSNAAFALGVRNLEVVTTPEPGTWPIVLLGGVAWLGVRRFRAKA